MPIKGQRVIGCLSLDLLVCLELRYILCSEMYGPLLPLSLGDLNTMFPL
jgi:hypothetical protein